MGHAIQTLVGSRLINNKVKQYLSLNRQELS